MEFGQFGFEFIGFLCVNLHKIKFIDELIMKLECPHCKTTFEVDESHYASLLAQVKTAEFDAEIARRMAELKEKQKAEENALKFQLEAQKAKELAQRNAEIAELRAKLNIIDKEHELDLLAEQNRAKEELSKLNHSITELKAQLSNQEILAKNAQLEQKKHNDELLKSKDEEIERLRDMKSRLSTKMLGETLELHCLNAFNLARSQGLFHEAYFGKDNDIVDGTKGDFIFRDYIDGEECLSIMFEMKNEDDATKNKHRNEDFFQKLDKDRQNKKCEYAVLVSTLEADSEVYNSGIVDVSYRYDKMYVIRPQFFVSIISLLSRSSKRSAQDLISLRSELAVAREQSIDITKFEERRDQFVATFKKHVEGHMKKHNDALDGIDKAIAAAEKQVENLRKIKLLFEDSAKKLIKANDAAENDFTIRKLTRGNPTMQAKFKDLHKDQ